MEKLCRNYLLRVARQFAKLNNLSINTVSRRFHGAVSFLDDFDSGTVTITLRKYDEMIRQFRREWPKHRRMPEPKW